MRRISVNVNEREKCIEVIVLVKMYGMVFKGSY